MVPKSYLQAQINAVQNPSIHSQCSMRPLVVSRHFLYAFCTGHIACLVELPVLLLDYSIQSSTSYSVTHGHKCIRDISTLARKLRNEASQDPTGQPEDCHVERTESSFLSFLAVVLKLDGSGIGWLLTCSRLAVTKLGKTTH